MAMGSIRPRASTFKSDHHVCFQPVKTIVGWLHDPIARGKTGSVFGRESRLSRISRGPLQG
jgi:hypothetical protein